MSHCPSCEHQDTVDLIDEILYSVGEGHIDRFKQACLDPKVTTMYDHERKAVVKMLDRLIAIKDDLPVLTEITKRKMEMKRNARQN